MEDILTTYIYLAGIMWIYMTAWFVLSLVLKRNDVADIAWGIGGVVATLSSLLLFGSWTTLQTILFVLVTVWGVRLALHIGTRLVGKPEDGRYAAWRKEWGKWVVLRSYAQVFVLQGAILLLVVAPLLIANTTGNSSTHLPFNVWIGMMLWIYGFLFEAVGDLQLRFFLNNPENKGKIMTNGVWKYTRHPNYFGEVTQWWAVWMMMLHLPFGWLGVIGPLTITYMILKVSGIPMLEKRYDGNPAFQEYKKRTSAFFPLPPKR